MQILLRQIRPDAKVSETPPGIDLHAFLLSLSGRPNTMLLPPRTTILVPVGFSLTSPGNTIRTVPIPSLALHSLFPLDIPIDSSSDEIRIFLYNGGLETYYLRHGDRIAQLVTTQIGTLRLSVTQ